jgi:hypothetical protein
MAYNRQIICVKCRQEKTIIVGSGSYRPPVCDECRDKEKVAKEENHFDKLDQMTLEQRVRRIEKILYDKPWKYMRFREPRF